MSEGGRRPSDHAPQAGHSARYKRAYKACETCRKHKAKCELETGAESCSKCVKEYRVCVFPPQRSNRPRRSPANRAAAQSKDNHARLSSVHNVQEVPLEPSFTEPDATQPPPEENDSYLPTDLHNDVMQTVVTSSNDAVGILFRAAGQEDSDGSEEVIPDRPLHHLNGSEFSTSPTNTHSPAMTTSGQISDDILDIWDQHRFVRQGWFTAREAVIYVELYSSNLSIRR